MPVSLEEADQVLVLGYGEDSILVFSGSIMKARLALL